VRDGIQMARLGKPAVALVTSDFWQQGNFVAKAAGMPDVPRIELPHPIASTGREYMRKVSENLAAHIVGALTTPAQPSSAATPHPREEPNG
jgi:hypothetical protein